MAPTSRSRASFKDIILSPAKLIRKKLLTNLKLRTNSRLLLSPSLGDISCSHNVIENFQTPEERKLRDLCIEDAATYSELAEINGQGIHRALSCCENVWASLWRGPLSRGGALTSAQRNAHKSFHENLLAKFKTVNTEILATLWKKPRVSCRYHVDLRKTHQQISNLHSITMMLVEDLLNYLEKCPTPVNLYGTRCNLTVRERLMEANGEVDRAKLVLREICACYGPRLKLQFAQFDHSCERLDEYLSRLNVGENAGSSLFLHMEE